MSRNKSTVVQIFQADGSTPVETLDLTKLKNKLTFSDQLNGGLGELTLDLSYPFDDFSEGTRIKAMNIVDVYAVEDSYPLGRRVYRGFMSQYEPYVLQNGATGVLVRCLGLVSLAQYVYYKNGSSFAVTHTTADPQTMGRAIIDALNTSYNLFSYSNDTTDPTGGSLSKTFTDKKIFDALKETQELTPDGWYWRIDANGVYWLKPKPVAATHLFVLGRDINWLRAPKSAENIINDVQVRYSGGNADGSDATSISAYGKRTQILMDTGLDSAAGAARNTKALADGKNMVIKASLQLNDTYDIESVHPGDTCQVLNTAYGNAFFDTNMTIIQVQWEGETATLQLGDYRADVAVEVARMVG